MIPNWPRDSKGRLLPKNALPQDFVPADPGAVSERLKQAAASEANTPKKPTPKPTPVEAEKMKESAALTRWEPTPEMSAMVGGAIGMVFSILSKRLGPTWVLDTQEQHDLGEAYARLLNKYQANSDYLPEIICITATSSLIGRMMLDTRDSKKSKPKIVNQASVKEAPDAARA